MGHVTRCVMFNGPLALALVLVLALGWQAARLFRLDLLFTATASEVSFWGRGTYQPDQPVRERTGRELQRLLKASPAQPDYLTLAASYYSWEAYRAPNAAVANKYDRLALDAQYAAQLSRPAYRQGWEKMIGYASRIEGAENSRKLAEQQLILLETSAAFAQGSQ